MRKVLFILGKLEDEDVEWLAGQGERRSLAAGERLIAAGTRIQTLYFVLDGELAVSTRKGRELTRLLSGEVIGELSLVDPAPTSANVTASRSSSVLAVSHAVLRERMHSNPGFFGRFYQALAVFMADRIRQTSARLGDGDPEDAGVGELNEELLDNLHLAGARFDMMLKQLGG